MLLENKAALYTMCYQNRLLNLQLNITQAISSFHASATYIKSKDGSIAPDKAEISTKNTGNTYTSKKYLIREAHFNIPETRIDIRK